MSPRLTSFPVVPRSANQLDRESGMMPIYGTMFSSDNTTGRSRLSHMRTHSAMSWRPPVEDRSRPRSHVLLAPPPKTTGRSRSRSMPPQHRHYLVLEKQQKEALCDANEDMDQQQREAVAQDPEADVDNSAIPDIPEIRPVFPSGTEIPLPMSARRTRPNTLLSPAIMPPYDMDKGTWQRRHSRNNTSATSPSSRSDFSHRSRNASIYEGIVERENDTATSPEDSEGEDERAKRKRGSLRYGTPEMPRGQASLPHRPPHALRPRARNNGHVKHLPRAEKLPLTGYELLAARLSAHAPHLKHSRRGSLEDVSTWSAQSANSAGLDGAVEELAAAQVPLKPLYRRFEALNHRILLHLQDELSELEEQLHRLDTTDTQTRRLQDKILPASRRTSSLVGGELQWHKTDILGKIGHKLGQYNHALSSFTKTQRLALPSQADIEDYRSYLTTQKPIAEIETRFIEATEDLVTLTGGRQRLSPSVLGFPSTPFSPGSPSYLPTLIEGRPIPESVQDHSASPTKPAVHYSAVPSKDLHFLVVAMAVAVLAPVLAFTAVPSITGRAMVTLLASIAVSCAMDGRAERRDVLLCSGMYGAVMAVLAGLF